MEGGGGTQPFTLGTMRIFKVSDMYTLVDSQELIIITTKTEILRVGDEHIEKEYIIVDADGNEITSKLIEAINRGPTLLLLTVFLLRVLQFLGRGMPP